MYVAAAMAGASLLQQLMAQQNAAEAEARAAKRDAVDKAETALQRGQENQISIQGQAGDREVSALQNLIGVFQRAAR